MRRSWLGGQRSPLLKRAGPPKGELKTHAPVLSPGFNRPVPATMH
jgi:hypothetical protein